MLRTCLSCIRFFYPDTVVAGCGGSCNGSCNGNAEQPSHAQPARSLTMFGPVLFVNLQYLDKSWLGGAALCIFNQLRVLSKLTSRVAYISPLCSAAHAHWSALNSSDPPRAERYELGRLCREFRICIRCSRSAATVSMHFIRKLPAIAEALGAKLVVRTDGA